MPEAVGLLCSRSEKTCSESPCTAMVQEAYGTRVSRPGLVQPHGACMLLKMIPELTTAQACVPPAGAAPVAAVLRHQCAAAAGAVCEQQQPGGAAAGARGAAEQRLAVAADWGALQGLHPSAAQCAQGPRPSSPLAAADCHGLPLQRRCPRRWCRAPSPQNDDPQKQSVTDKKDCAANRRCRATFRSPTRWSSRSPPCRRRTTCSKQ